MGKDNIVDEIHEEGVEVIKDSEQFPCPACGATMRFSPETQGLKCDYCEATVDLDSDDTTIIEYPLSEAEDKANHNWGGQKIILKCQQCGGQTIVDSTTHATNCVFCGSSQVAKTEGEIGIKPESVVPFGITQKEAENRFVKWIKKRFYAPRKLKKELSFENLQGLYIPFFTYDADTSTAYTAKRGDYYYTTRSKTVNGKVVTERVRHTRWRTVHGVLNRYFDDVLVNASDKVDDKLVGRMGGFDYRTLKHYQPELLAGFSAEKYALSLKEGWDKGREVVDDQIYGGIRSQVGGDEFRLLNKSTNYGEVKFKHILLPLYMASFKYRKRIYQFIVHGESGRVASEYPKSVIKILATLLFFGLAFYLIYLYMSTH